MGNIMEKLELTAQSTASAELTIFLPNFLWAE